MFHITDLRLSCPSSANMNYYSCFEQTIWFMIASFKITQYTFLNVSSKVQAKQKLDLFLFSDKSSVLLIKWYTEKSLIAFPYINTILLSCWRVYLVIKPTQYILPFKKLPSDYQVIINWVLLRITLLIIGLNFTFLK